MIVSTKRWWARSLMSDVKQTGRATASGERRRRRLWSADEKRQIVAETLAPGASVSIVARRHDLNANMLFTWRRELGEEIAEGVAGEAVRFVPAAITSEVAVSALPATTVAGRMEIVLSGGDRVIVAADVDPASLARVIKVLSRR
jgi:transposase